MSALQLPSSRRLTVPTCSRYLTSTHATFQTGHQAQSSLQTTPSAPRAPRKQLKVTSFKFLKQLGLKKPGFLPDFGKDKRLAILNRFYTSLDKATYEEILADSLTLSTAAAGHSTYNKSDYIRYLTEVVRPAIPDFSWGHVTSGDKSDEGYSIVKVQATGHHSGDALQMPNKEPIAPSGSRFQLNEETQKVKVEDGQIQEIVILPRKGAGLTALVEELKSKAGAK